MSDGNAWELTDRSKTQSFRYDGNVQGFPKDLNRSKQKGLTLYRIDHIKNKSPYIGGFKYNLFTRTIHYFSHSTWAIPI